MPFITVKCKIQFSHGKIGTCGKNVVKSQNFFYLCFTFTKNLQIVLIFKDFTNFLPIYFVCNFIPIVYQNLQQ